MSAPSEQFAAGPPSARRPGDGRDRPGTSRRPGRVLTTLTAVAVGLLALLHALDLIQILLELPFTAHDLALTLGVLNRGDYPLAVGLPLNLAQTLGLAVVAGVALIGGLLCLGRRRGGARIGGFLAILAVVLPFTLPLLFAPLAMLGQSTFYEYAMMADLLYVGGPILVAAAGLVPGLVAAILLIRARPDASRPLGVGYGIAGVVLSAVFVLEAAAAGLRQVSGLLEQWAVNWWALNWAGVSGPNPSMTLVLCLALLAVMVSAGLGSGLLLGSASMLTRIGGGLLAAALVVRVLSQIVSWGVGHWLYNRAVQMFEYTWVYAIEWTHMVGVLVLGVPGLLLAVIGLFTGPKRAPADATTPGVRAEGLGGSQSA